MGGALTSPNGAFALVEPASRTVHLLLAGAWRPRRPGAAQVVGLNNGQ